MNSEATVSRDPKIGIIQPNPPVMVDGKINPEWEAIFGKLPEPTARVAEDASAPVKPRDEDPHLGS